MPSGHQQRSWTQPGRPVRDPGSSSLTVPRLRSPAVAADVFDLLAVAHERRAAGGEVAAGGDGLPEELHLSQTERPPSFPRSLTLGDGWLRC